MVKRYDPALPDGRVRMPSMNERDDGDYVLHEELAALQARYDRLLECTTEAKRMLEEWESTTENCEEIADRIEEALDEVGYYDESESE